MGKIPDGRSDTSCNQKYLNESDAAVLTGFDMAVEEISGLFQNLDQYIEDFEFNDEDINLVRFLQKHERVCSQLLYTVRDWQEKGRNNLIADLIEGMDDEEYERSRAEVDGGCRRPYYIGDLGRKLV